MSKDKIKNKKKLKKELIYATEQLIKTGHSDSDIEFVITLFYGLGDYQKFVKSIGVDIIKEAHKKADVEFFESVANYKGEKRYIISTDPSFTDKCQEVFDGSANTPKVIGALTKEELEDLLNKDRRPLVRMSFPSKAFAIGDADTGRVSMATDGLEFATKNAMNADKPCRAETGYEDFLNIKDIKVNDLFINSNSKGRFRISNILCGKNEKTNELYRVINYKGADEDNEIRNNYVDEETFRLHFVRIPDIGDPNDLSGFPEGDVAVSQELKDKAIAEEMAKLKDDGKNLILEIAFGTGNKSRIITNPITKEKIELNWDSYFINKKNYAYVQRFTFKEKYIENILLCLLDKEKGFGLPEKIFIGFESFKSFRNKIFKSKLNGIIDSSITIVSDTEEYKIRIYENELIELNLDSDILKPEFDLDIDGDDKSKVKDINDFYYYNYFKNKEK